MHSKRPADLPVSGERRSFAGKELHAYTGRDNRLPRQIARCGRACRRGLSSNGTELLGKASFRPDNKYAYRARRKVTPPRRWKWPTSSPAAPMRCTESLPRSTNDRKPVASSLPARCAASVCFGGGALLCCSRCRSVALSHESCLRFALRPIHGFVGSPVPLAFSPALVSGLGAAPEDRDTQTSNHTKADHR